MRFLIDTSYGEIRLEDGTLEDVFELLNRMQDQYPTDELKLVTDGLVNMTGEMVIRFEALDLGDE